MKIRLKRKEESGREWRVYSGKWHSKIAYQTQNWKVLSSIPMILLAMQLCYKVPAELDKEQELTSSEWGCILTGGPKLASGQPNN